MKIFENDSDKVNFVDDHNVFVGYDMDQQCCESADWFISEKEESIMIKRTERDLIPYSFDTKFFKRVDGTGYEGNYSSLDEGSVVIFKLIAEGKQDLFLHIYNCHNGYYSHGFESSVDGIDWQSGRL